MAITADIHSAAFSAIEFITKPQRLPSTAQERCSLPPRHQTHHIVWKIHHSPHPTPCIVSKPTSSLALSKHDIFILDRHRMTPDVSPSRLPSSSPCCLSRLNLSICMCTCKSKCLSNRLILVTMSATADSDPSFPSHEEDGDRSIGCFKEDGGVTLKKPSPEIEPGDVVQAQLRALRDKDFMTVFEFASPKNKAHTGPLSRFSEMIQGKAYNVMLGHKSAEVLSSLSVGPERFQQRVLIKGANGRQAVFSWSLSKQETEPFQDCWMTDSVHRDE